MTEVCPQTLLKDPWKNYFDFKRKFLESQDTHLKDNRPSNY